MKQLYALLVGLSVFSALAGCNRNHSPITDRKDVVDSDFVATISKTRTTSVFMIEVKKVNKQNDKKIGSLPITVHLALVDKRGWKHVAGSYSENVDYTLENLSRPAAESVKGRVRLRKPDLQPGVYMVEPQVRICEVGKDSMRGPYADMGSVAVPAGNSIKVTVTK